MKRRSYLATASLGVATATGCLGNALSLSSCKLHHEVSPRESDGGYGGTELAYSELTERSQVVFKKALDSGEYTVSYDGENAPDDFSYSDEMSIYIITFQNDEFTLFTYTDAGCNVD